MSFQAIATTVLLSISSLLGVQAVPPDTKSWTVTRGWEEIPGPANGQQTFMRLEAQTTAIPEVCTQHPEKYVVFPAIIHGSHVIRLDGQVVFTFGDPSFKTMRSFYGQPALSCKDLKGGKVLTWEAYSYTKYFARINYFPEVQASHPLYNVFAETFHIIGAGAGWIMAILTFTIFAGKVNRKTTLAVCLSSFFSSFYLGGCVAGFMGLPWSMLTVHKVADIGVWLAICSLVNALYHENLVSRLTFNIYLSAVILAIGLILIGPTGDCVQFGTTIPFGLTLVVLLIPMFRLGKMLPHWKRDRLTRLQFLALGSFVAAVFNEMFAVTGLIHSSPMLPFGFMSGVMFLALSVNERVNATYRERDYLRANLEREVKKALDDLKATQAELVQSAKLASLGTLSAGIAHEINNSLNYVNGALQPLEKIVESSAAPGDRDKVRKLLSVMKDGLALTLEIIKGLRTYTGLNQAKFNEVNIANVVNSSLTILRNRIRGKIEVKVDIPEKLSVFGAVVGLNQIFMNLISNAIDAMGASGTLTVSASVENSSVHLVIQDSGGGIPKEIQDRIFEPFFTTKDVGSGTGLGLYIVKQEIDRHKGTIRVESKVGEGTAFHIFLPLQATMAEPSEPSPREAA